MIGVIGGTGLRRPGLADGSSREVFRTLYGEVTVFVGENACFIPRHGLKHNIPPHRINHRAHLKALEAAGVSEIVGVSSAGSLKKGIKPGSIVIPDDYIDLTVGQTFFDDTVKHITPSFDKGLREKLLKAAGKAGVRALAKGVYIQTRGPRLETRAEVRMLSRFGDLVGMTAASEATLAKELGLKYACACSVDNYAHGIVRGHLDFEKVVEGAKKNSGRIESIVEEVVR